MFKTGDQVRFINPDPQSPEYGVWRIYTQFHLLIGTLHKVIYKNSFDWIGLDPGLPGFQFHISWLELVTTKSEIIECQCPNLLSGHSKTCQYPKRK